MFDFVPALVLGPLRVTRRLAGSLLGSLEALPRIVGALAELREAVGHLERLSTFAAGELPEIVHQLEATREQLAAIERRLAGVTGDRLSPGSPRSG